MIERSIKQCGCCGLEWTPESWEGLGFIGKMELAVRGHPQHLRCLELRNCLCGSTLGIQSMRLATVTSEAQK